MASGYQTPTKADLKPSKWSWTGLSTRMTQSGVKENFSKWVGRSRPLTGGGATKGIGATYFPSQKSNVQVQPQGQQQHGGTFLGFSSMIPVGVDSYVNPHLEPLNQVLVNMNSHAPAVVPSFMSGMGMSGGVNLVFKGADGLKPPQSAGGAGPNQVSTSFRVPRSPAGFWSQAAMKSAKGA